jgi:hypothetical protein
MEPSHFDPDPEVSARARPPRRYTAKYKAGILAEYEGLSKGDKGALLRREGLYSSFDSVGVKAPTRSGAAAPSPVGATEIRTMKDRMSSQPTLGATDRVADDGSRASSFELRNAS